MRNHGRVSCNLGGAAAAGEWGILADAPAQVSAGRCGNARRAYLVIGASKRRFSLIQQARHRKSNQPPGPPDRNQGPAVKAARSE
jgi:hypothetical protein